MRESTGIGWNFWKCVTRSCWPAHTMSKPPSRAARASVSTALKLSGLGFASGCVPNRVSVNFMASLSRASARDDHLLAVPDLGAEQRGPRLALGVELDVAGEPHVGRGCQRLAEGLGLGAL